MGRIAGKSVGPVGAGQPGRMDGGAESALIVVHEIGRSTAGSVSVVEAG